MKQQIRISISCLLLFIGLQSTAQIGIGAPIVDPKIQLDVNTQIALPDVKNTENLDEYNRIIVSDEDGNIGYRTELKNHLEFRTNYIDKIKTPIKIETSQKNSWIKIPLFLSTTIEAGKSVVVEVNYSMPAFIKSNSLDNNGKIEILITKSINNEEPIALQKNSRVITLADSYKFNSSAKGAPISNKYFDRVTNNSTNQITVTYSLEALSTANKTVGIGMYAPGENYNWGRGMIMMNVYDVIN